MSSTTTRSRNVAQRRRRILASATELANTGAGDFTVRDLAAHAELTVPTLYNLIGGKDAIVAALIGAALDDLERSLAGVVGHRGVARAEALVDASLSVYADDAETYRAVFRMLQEVEGAPGSEALRSLFVRAGDLQRTALIEAREDGHVAGALDPTVLAHDILHAFLRATRLWAIGAWPIEVASARARYALHLALLADATSAGRKLVLPRLRESEARLKEPAR